MSTTFTFSPNGQIFELVPDSGKNPRPFLLVERDRMVDSAARFLPWDEALTTDYRKRMVVAHANGRTLVAAEFEEELEAMRELDAVYFDASIYNQM